MTLPKKNSNLSISDETNFSIVGDVELTRGNHVWSIPKWSQEFRIEFDILVEMEINVTVVNVFRITNTDNDYFEQGMDVSNGLGDRIPALFVFQNKQFGFRFRVNGNNNYDIQVGPNANVNIQVDNGNLNVVTKTGQFNFDVGSDMNVNVGGNYNLNVQGSETKTVEGTTTHNTTGSTTIRGSTIDLNP